MIRTFHRWCWKMQRAIHTRNASNTYINDKIMWPSRATVTGQPTKFCPGPIPTSILLGRWTIGESCEKFHYGDRTSQYFATEAKGQTVHAKRSTGNCNWPDNEWVACCLVAIIKLPLNRSTRSPETRAEDIKRSLHYIADSTERIKQRLQLIYV